MTGEEYLQLARLLSKLCYSGFLSHRKRDVIWEIIEHCIHGAMACLLQTEHKNDIPF
jgi:hypothetical protein